MSSSLSLSEERRVPLEEWQAILLLIPSSLLTLWTILSNLFVIIAVFCFRHMRTPSNIYIASLASTDFLLGLLILPLSILQIYYNEWLLGPHLCKLWMTLDVTLSTLSILHLIAIAQDRYRVVSDGIHYLQNQKKTDVVIIIVCLWALGIWIATPPVLGWGDWSEIELKSSYFCDYSSTLGYVVHSTFGAFLMPMTILIWTYWNIYKMIQARLRKRPPVPSLAIILEESETEGNLLNIQTPEGSPRPTSQIQDFVSQKIRFSLTKERRAARTLGVIIGAFTTCWLPFSIMYSLRPIAGNPPLLIYHGFTWMGYLNSAINPVIYCVYNEEYRKIFWKIIACKFIRKRRGLIRKEGSKSKTRSNSVVV